MKSILLDQTAKQYILDCIDLSAYDDGATTAQEAAIKVVDYIMKEADHEYNRKRLVTDQAIIADHLMGLPSYINIDFENNKIIDIAVKWGSLPALHSISQADRITSNWFNFIAIKLLQIKNGYRIKGLKWEEQQ